MKRKYYFYFILIILILIVSLCPYIPSKAVGTALSTEKSLISFGTLSYGDVTEYKAVTIFNNTEDDIDIAWEKADSDDMLIIDAPADTKISAGGYANFYVKTTDELTPGKHLSSLYIYDSTNDTYENNLKIDFSVTILLDAPYVSDIDIYPSTGNISASGAIQFQAKTHSHNNASEKVYWDVIGAYSNMTSIDSQGLLTIGADETAPLLKVTATSQIDSSVYTSALISVTSDDYTISPYASHLEGGCVTYSTTTPRSSSVILSAYPYDKYTFKGWYLGGNLISTNSQMMASDINESNIYKAVFEPMAYDINIKKNHPNGGAVSSSSTPSKGSHITIMAIPNDGYVFEGWYRDNELISDESSYSIDYVNSDINFLACFSPREIDIQGHVYPENSGTVEGLGKAYKTSEATLSAVANDGYEFAYYTLNGDIVSFNPEYTITHPQSDMYVKAYFKPIEESLTYSIVSGTTSNNGRISYAGERITAKGSSLLYTISPNSGYVVSDVCVDGYSVGAISSYTFKNINDNHLIIAKFIKASDVNIPMESAHTDSINKIKEAYESMGIENSTATRNVNGTNVVDDAFLEEHLPDFIFSDNSVTMSYDMDEMTGLLGIMGLTPSEARAALGFGNQNLFLSQAESSGYLSIILYNEMGNQIGQTLSYTYMPDLHDIAYNYISADDITALINGSKINIGIYILKATDTIIPKDKELIDSYKVGGIKIDDDCYFDMLVVKNNSGYIETYRDLAHPITVTIDIPEKIASDGRTYYILNVMSDANGDPILSCITDEDDNPNTITFTTSSLSTYALAYTDEPTIRSSLTASPYTMVIIALCALSVIGISIYIIVYGNNSKKKNGR